MLSLLSDHEARQNFGRVYAPIGVKLLSDHEARFLSGPIYGPIGVKLLMTHLLQLPWLKVHLFATCVNQTHAIWAYLVHTLWLNWCTPCG